MKDVHKPGSYNQVQQDKHEGQGSGNPGNNTYAPKNPNTKQNKHKTKQWGIRGTVQVPIVRMQFQPTNFP